jgi:hypothetical protein
VSKLHVLDVTENCVWLDCPSASADINPWSIHVKAPVSIFASVDSQVSLHTTGSSLCDSMPVSSEVLRQSARMKYAGCNKCYPFIARVGYTFLVLQVEFFLYCSASVSFFGIWCSSLRSSSKILMYKQPF